MGLRPICGHCQATRARHVLLPAGERTRKPSNVLIHAAAAEGGLSVMLYQLMNELH
jgi:hypothetical protein